MIEIQRVDTSRWVDVEGGTDRATEVGEWFDTSILMRALFLGSGHDYPKQRAWDDVTLDKIIPTGGADRVETSPLSTQARLPS